MPFQHFLQSEDGAVVVDWVVLTAAAVGLGLAAMAVVSGGVEDLSGEIQTELASIDPGTLFDWGANTASAFGAWGDLEIFSPRQSAEQAESYVAAILASNGGDYQAAYDQLYQQALDMTYADGESIDDLGAFEALAAENGVTLETGDNMTYGELHTIYDANGSL